MILFVLFDVTVFVVLVLHIAASCGKWKVVEWLVSEMGMFLNSNRKVVVRIH